MEIKDVRLTQQGKTIDGDPQAGKYYRVEVPEGTDIKKAALEFKKKFPKSFFMFRASKKLAAGGNDQKTAKA